MNVLFEYPAADYRAVVECDRPSLIRNIERHLRNAGVSFPQVFLLSQDTRAVPGDDATTDFYLQRYNPQWGCYVNVDSIEEAQDGDKLGVAKIPRKPTSKSTPAEEAAQTSSSNENDSDAGQTSKKGKGKMKKRTPRNIKVRCLLLDKYQENVPRGTAREEMEYDGKFKRINATNETSPAQVRERICNSYKIDQFKYLECIRSGNKLIVSSNQKMNGKDAILRRGCLYLCKEETTSTTSEIELPPGPLAKKMKKTATTTKPIVIDDDSDEIKIGDVATTSARVLAHDKAKKVMEMCKLCEDVAQDCVMVPCGQTGICTECGDKLFHSGQPCPFCRNEITYLQKVFFS